MIKKLAFFIISSILLTSCSQYTSLTKETYDVMLRDSNLQSVTFICEREIPIVMTNPDTIISTTNKRGVCKFDYIKRKVYTIPKNQQIRIVECYNHNVFKIEFVDYDFQVYMIPYGKEFIIRKDADGSIYRSNYKTTVDYPKIKFRIRKANSVQLISLKR